MENSKFGKLGKNDIVKGLVVTILTALLSGLYQLLTTDNLSLDTIRPVLIATATAGISYLLKNWLSNSNGEPLKPEVLDGNGGVVIDK